MHVVLPLAHQCARCLQVQLLLDRKANVHLRSVEGTSVRDAADPSVHSLLDSELAKTPERDQETVVAEEPKRHTRSAFLNLTSRLLSKTRISKAAEAVHAC